METDPTQILTQWPLVLRNSVNNGQLKEKSMGALEGKVAVITGGNIGIG